MKKTFLALSFVLCVFFTASQALAASWDGATLSGNGEFTDSISNGAVAIAITPSDGSIIVLGDTTTTGTVTHTAGDTSVYFGKNDGGTLSGGTNSWGAFDGRNNTHTYFAGSSATSITGSFNLGYANTAYVYIQDNAVLNVDGSFLLNQSSGGKGGIVEQAGGIVNITGPNTAFFRIGHWPGTAASPSQYNISSGELNVTTMQTSVGWDGPGELNISGDAVVNIQNLHLARGGSGTLNLTGGTLKLGGDVTKGSGSGTANLGNGTIVAKADHTWSGVAVKLTATGANATVFDTTDGNITISSAITDVGGLVLTGGGTMTLSNTGNTYAGGTVVKDGTLSLTAGGEKGVLVGNLTIEKDGTVLSTANNSFGWGSSKINTVTINGGTLTHTGTEDLGWGVTYNLTGALMETKKATETSQLGRFSLGSGSVVNVLKSDTATEIKGAITLREASTVFNVARGTAATDLLINARMWTNQAGTFGFTKNGDGIMTLAGAYESTGGITVNGGSLILDGGRINSNIPITVNTGGTFDATKAANNNAGRFVLGRNNGTAKLIIDGGTAIVGGLLSGDNTGGDSAKGELELKGGGTLIIGGNVNQDTGLSTYKLGTGTIQSSASHTWGSGLPNVTFETGGVTTFNAADKDHVIKFNPKATGSGSVTVTGPGKVIIDHKETIIGGNLTVDGGNLELATDNGAQKGKITGKLTIKDGGTLTLASNG